MSRPPLGPLAPVQKEDTEAECDSIPQQERKEHEQKKEEEATAEGEDLQLGVSTSAAASSSAAQLTNSDKTASTAMVTSW